MISFSETLPKEKAAYLDFQYVKRLYNEQTTEQIIVRNASSMIFFKNLICISIQSKSMDWFLCDRDLRHERAIVNNYALLQKSYFLTRLLNYSRSSVSHLTRYHENCLNCGELDLSRMSLKHRDYHYVTA